MPALEHLANRDLRTTVLEPSSEPPASARVVVVGGGIVGASIAYHLTELGVRDVVVVERIGLTAGTTWHAAGLVAQVRGTHALTELSRINAPLYASLKRETGVDPNFRRVGALTVARTPGRMQELHAGISMARDFGVEAHVLEPKEVLDRWPAAVVDDLAGATLFPMDGTVNPGDAALALAKGARDRGATFVFGATVTGFTLKRGRVVGVVTDVGTIACETTVLAAGLWTSELARLAGASVSLYPAEHVWVMTQELREAEHNLPVMRDLDGHFYIRTYRGRFLFGAFEPKGKPKAPRDIATGGFVEFGEDWDHFTPVLGALRERLPVLDGNVRFTYYLRAPESFTPDTNFHLGEFPEVPGLWVAAGFNSQGIIFAPGAGKALAEWIVEGHPTMDLSEVDVARAGRWANDRRWLHDKTFETLGRLYAMHWPNLQPDRGRGVRRFPLDERLRGAGAAFGEAGGWERPAWYEPGATEEPVWGYDFDRPSWFEAVAEEMRAAREGVALFDLSSYAKFLVQGAKAKAGLQRLCAANVDVPVGRVVYTPICNERGGIEMDPTVTRLAPDRYLVIAPTLYQRRTEGLLRNGLPPAAAVTDQTSAHAVLHLAGPKSRALLAKLTDADLSDDAFPFLAARGIEVAWAQAWALRVSYTGELGWELYVPTEFARGLYDAIVEAGAKFGLRHAGAFAFDALRLERGFRSWGHDMGTQDDPYAAGLGFTVDLDTDPVGADALAALARDPRERSLVSVLLEEPEPMLWHGEPVLRGHERIGHVTSGAYGSTLGAAVGLAWIHGDVPPDGAVSVEVRGRLVPATLSAAPFYDPKGERAR
ncbi:MAG TPA: FAD-dependent oxidoreductase [Actinomycetota bacterium]|nr:FAD-dependent oxidoreductase [Actinomycetota bacterium]